MLPVLAFRDWKLPQLADFEFELDFVEFVLECESELEMEVEVQLEAEQAEIEFEEFQWGVAMAAVESLVSENSALVSAQYCTFVIVAVNSTNGEKHHLGKTPLPWSLKTSEPHAFAVLEFHF